MPVHLTCQNCGRTFAVPPSRASEARYCSNDCRPRTERMVRPDGYVWVWMPDHPDAHRNGRLPEHRLVAEQVLGRRLRSDEDVHHRNEVRHDNRPENLEVLPHSDHKRLRHTIAKWSRNWDSCRVCNQKAVPHIAHGLCQRCYDMARRPPPPRFDWSLKHERCRNCGTTSTRHYALGLCVHCYDRQRQR